MKGRGGKGWTKEEKEGKKVMDEEGAREREGKRGSRRCR